MTNEEAEWLNHLEHIILKLKSGEYDGTDIMHAWIYLEELFEVREQLWSNPLA